MNWDELYSIEKIPTLEQISSFTNNSLWNELCEYIEKTYNVSPKVEYSKCPMAKGWNVKYKKNSRAICTLYPHKDYFTCMVSIGSKEAVEAEAFIGTCGNYIKELYKSANPFNGSRWLMIDVTNAEIFNETKELISIRMKSKN